ncbi:hypothetical protein GW17_00014143 [Ensete ventricosum]|nr:hypothetical protein GW17_00014143 [Ensete ventricosum]
MRTYSHEPRDLLAEAMADIRFVVGSWIPNRDILRALALAGCNASRALNILLYTPELLAADDPLPFESCDDGFPGAARAHFVPYLNPRPISALRPDIAYRRLQPCSAPKTAELEELPVEPVWFLVAKTCADFTPEELNKRKRSLNLEGGDEDESMQIAGLRNQQRRGQTYPEQSKDEQAISESSLNKLVGAAEVYDLEVSSST